jgi:hypothetical protein
VNELFRGHELNHQPLTSDQIIKIRNVEAWETDPWVPPAVLAVECFPAMVVDPCVGRGLWSRPFQRAGHSVWTVDLVDWSKHFDGAPRPDTVADFLTVDTKYLDWWRPDRDFAVVMNPPFSGDDRMLACHFVDRALELGARKVVCFQRMSWLESRVRSKWWDRNSPARVWCCIDRATCWRFDTPDECNDSCHLDREEKKARRKAGGLVGCKKCLGGTSESYAVFVWERGHGNGRTMLMLGKGDAG